MSAINIILRGSTAYVLTDGAGYTPEGRLVSTQQKVCPIAPLSLALAVRGSTAIWPPLQGFVNELHDSFDSVVNGFAETYDLMLSRQSAEFEKLSVGPHEVYVVGISESSGAAEAYVFVNDPVYGLPVRELVELSEGLVCPADMPFLEALETGGLHPGSEGFDPERDGLRLLEAQRARPWPTGTSGPPVKAVGGFAQLTTITAGRITTEIVRRWPDQVGEKIAPGVVAASSAGSQRLQATGGTG